MKLLNIGLVALILLIIVTFLRCASTQRFETTIPLTIGKVYYSESNGGIEITIPIISNPKNIVLDSVYFKDKTMQLEHKTPLVFIGRFKKAETKTKDIILSSNPLEEFGNKPPGVSKKIPFQLKENECVVTYNEANKVKYLKLDNIINKEL